MIKRTVYARFMIETREIFDLESGRTMDECMVNNSASTLPHDRLALAQQFTSQLSF